MLCIIAASYILQQNPKSRKLPGLAGIILSAITDLLSDLQDVTIPL